jgi:hypothetical protein
LGGSIDKQNFKNYCVNFILELSFTLLCLPKFVGEIVFASPSVCPSALSGLHRSNYWWDFDQTLKE